MDIVRRSDWLQRRKDSRDRIAAADQQIDETNAAMLRACSTTSAGVPVLTPTATMIAQNPQQEVTLNVEWILAAMMYHEHVGSKRVSDMLVDVLKTVKTASDEDDHKGDWRVYLHNQIENQDLAAAFIDLLGSVS